jgi:hypothetical protein
VTFVTWSTEEDERLRQLALTGASLAQIAELMRRNKSSVRNRASKLEIAIARDRNPMQKDVRSRHWTEADDQRLKELALAGCSAQQIAMELNRNVPAVRYRCEKFGLAIKQVNVPAR